MFSLIIVLTTLGVTMNRANVNVDEEGGGHRLGDLRFSPVSLRIDHRQDATTGSYSGAASLVSAIVHFHSDALKHDATS